MTILRQAIGKIMSRFVQFLLVAALMTRMVIVLVFDITGRSIGRGKIGAFAGAAVLALFFIVAIPTCFLLLLTLPVTRLPGRLARARAARRQKA